MNFDIFITIYSTLSKNFLLNPFFLSNETVILHLQTKTLFLHVRTSKSSRRHPVSTRSI